MAKTINYGPLRIVAIEAGKTEGWAYVRMEQIFTTTYEGTNDESATGLGLQNALGTPKTYEEKRKCNESLEVKLLESNNLREGSEIPNLKICRYAHQIPVWDGHEPRGDGRFYTTKIVGLDKPNRVEVPLEESQKMYNAWKAATGAGSKPTAQTNPHPLAEA